MSCDQPEVDLPVVVGSGWTVRQSDSPEDSHLPPRHEPICHKGEVERGGREEGRGRREEGRREEGGGKRGEGKREEGGGERGEKRREEGEGKRGEKRKKNRRGEEGGDGK